MSKISEQRRQEILDAAQTEFSLGIEQASMSGIAARAGIGKSTIYEYFPSKGELLIEVCKRYIHRLEQQVEEALEQDGPFREKLLAFSRVVLNTTDGIDPISVVQVMANNAVMAELAENAQGLMHFTSERMERAVRLAQDRGEIDPALNTQLAACYLLNLPNPRQMQYLSSLGLPDPLEQYVDLAMQSLTVPTAR